MEATNGKVLWITGLSGVGKTTLAKIVLQQVKSAGGLVIHLDGDEVREVICDENCGHDHASRLKNAYRICRLAKLLADQGTTVIISTMSLFHEIHAWNRENLPRYVECYITAPEKELIERDPKGIYAKAIQVNENNVPGINLDFEPPLTPHLVINNSDSSTAELEKRASLIAASFNSL